jgi:hypothetical protein
MDSLSHFFGYIYLSSNFSGIGKCLAEKLAKQGLNIVLVAIDDNLLKTTHQELCERFEINTTAPELSEFYFFKKDFPLNKFEQLE